MKGASSTGITIDFATGAFYAIVLLIGLLVVKELTDRKYVKMDSLLFFNRYLNNIILGLLAVFVCTVAFKVYFALL